MGAGSNPKLHPDTNKRQKTNAPAFFSKKLRADVFFVIYGPNGLVENKEQSRTCQRVLEIISNYFPPRFQAVFCAVIPPSAAPANPAPATPYLNRWILGNPTIRANS